MLRLLLVVSLLSGAGAGPMIGELLHLIRSLEKRAASAAVTDSIAHRLANPASVINSIQRGSISVAQDSSNTATITSVTTSKSFMVSLGLVSGGGAAAGRWSVYLTNATTVTATQANGAGGTASVGYEVVEYK